MLIFLRPAYIMFTIMLTGMRWLVRSVFRRMKIRYFENSSDGYNYLWHEMEIRLIQRLVVTRGTDSVYAGPDGGQTWLSPIFGDV
jgi:hypothetical protein